MFPKNGTVAYCRIISSPVSVVVCSFVLGWFSIKFVK